MAIASLLDLPPLSSGSQMDKDIKREPLFDKAILPSSSSSSEQRIKEIGESIEPEFYDVITDYQKAGQILVELSKSIKNEALILLPRDKSMVRLDRLGVFDYIIMVSQENGAKVKIICPLSQVNFDIVKRILASSSNIKILDGNNSSYACL